jgi:hypothetical protein
MTRILGIGVMMAALTAGTVAGCLSSGEGSENFTEDGKLGTKATYDAESGQILVSFAEELEEGQSLYLSVRRGNLQEESYAKKDCSLVADRAIAIFGGGKADKGELSPQAREAHGERTIYRLPLEDKSLLVPAYSDSNLPTDQSWGHGDLTGEKQAILDAGVDTFIDICVTQGDGVLRREQQDLYLAMDNNNPHLVRDAMASDASGSVAGADEFDHNQARATSPQKYGEICVAALGEIPFFKNKREAGTDPVTGRPQYKYDTWNCLDSVHIPLTVTKASGDTETVEGPEWDEESGSENSGAKCDKRQYIYNLCEQAPRVISAMNEQGTTWVLLCRKGRGQTPKLVQEGWDENGEPIMKNTVATSDLSTKFNDIAMLGHNPRTGRTCFFQNALYSRTNGKAVSHPADIDKWDDIWSGVHGAQGGINCNNCHDSDPWILTPWIAGAKRDAVYKKAQQKMSGSGKNGWVADADLPATASVVPMYGVHPDLPLKDTSVPYTLVNFVGQGWKHEKQLVGTEVKGCNSCHRIGAGNTLAKWALRTVGQDSAYNNMITDAYKNNYERSHYMPFDPRPGQPDPLPAEADWANSEYAKAIAHIKSCQSAPQDGSSTTCQFKEIPREVMGIDPGNECHSPIPDDCDY